MFLAEMFYRQLSPEFQFQWRLLIASKRLSYCIFLGIEIFSFSFGFMLTLLADPETISLPTSIFYLPENYSKQVITLVNKVTSLQTRSSINHDVLFAFMGEVKNCTSIFIPIWK